MARRTKEDALATRHSLLDAAERMFHAKGVSATSLNDIAVEAGTTRGAIYWHFKDKADLYNAMMDRVSLPMEHALTTASRQEDPLAGMRAAILGSLGVVVNDARTRRVFEVATHKVEYIDSLCEVRRRHLEVRAECLASLKQALLAGARQRGHRLPVSGESAARGLYALLDGLMQNWLLDNSSFDLLRAGTEALDTYLAGLGLASRP